MSDLHIICRFRGDMFFRHLGIRGDERQHGDRICGLQMRTMSRWRQLLQEPELLLVMLLLLLSSSSSPRLLSSLLWLLLPFCSSHVSVEDVFITFSSASFSEASPINSGDVNEGTTSRCPLSGESTRVASIITHHIVSCEVTRRSSKSRAWCVVFA